ncbi:MAG: hypothetical protein ACWA44_06360 [Thiotrichales bacterium]
MWKRILTPLALAAPQLLSAETLSLSARLDNYCSHGLPETDFNCGMEPQKSNFEDLDGNGVFDIYEPGRTVSITLELPEAPAGYEYIASSNGTLRLEAFGDLDSEPLPPENPAELTEDGYYDHEWMDVAMEEISLGRIFDGIQEDDRFNIGVEQQWWPYGYDRGTLWGAAGPAVIYGEAEILQSELTSVIKDGKVIVEFGLARSHNDLTGHPYFDLREEFIALTLSFDAELTPVTKLSADAVQQHPAVLGESESRTAEPATQGGGCMGLLWLTGLAAMRLRAPRSINPSPGQLNSGKYDRI